MGYPGDGGVMKWWCVRRVGLLTATGVAVLVVACASSHDTAPDFDAGASFDAGPPPFPRVEACRRDFEWSTDPPGIGGASLLVSEDYSGSPHGEAEVSFGSVHMGGKLMSEALAASVQTAPVGVAAVAENLEPSGDVFPGFLEVGQSDVLPPYLIVQRAQVRFGRGSCLELRIEMFPPSEIRSVLDGNEPTERYVFEGAGLVTLACASFIVDRIQPDFDFMTPYCRSLARWL